MENRFVLDDYMESQKLQLAHGFIEDEAESYVNWRQSMQIIQNWEDLMIGLLMKFGDEDNPELLHCNTPIPHFGVISNIYLKPIKFHSLKH